MRKTHLLVGDLCSRGSVIDRLYIVNCGSTLANFLNLNVSQPNTSYCTALIFLELVLLITN